MQDLVFVVILTAFFALSVLLIKACDRIIGPEPVTSVEDTEEAERQAA
jgi:hypothetical protein